MNLMTMNHRARAVGYLLRDEFTTDRAAGAVSGTASETIGPLRTTIEIDGTITIADGVLNMSGQESVTYGELVLYYQLKYPRYAGRTFEFRVRRHGAGACGRIGLFTGSGAFGLGDAIHAFAIANGGGLTMRGDPSNSGAGTMADETWTVLKIVLKDTGCDYYVDGVYKGSGTTSTISALWVGITDGDLSLDVDYIKVYGGPDMGGLVITFDDSLANVYGGFEYAVSKGVMGTVYAITNAIGTGIYLTAEQLATMNTAGWAIGSHCDHVQLATLTEAQQETKLLEATAILDGLGLTRASRHVAYPNASYNADTLTAMAATGMKTGRIVGNAIATLATAVYEIPVTYGTVLTTTTVTQLQTAIRNGLGATGGWPFLLFHNLADEPSNGEWSNANWQALIDWIAANGIRTKTIVDYFNAR